MDDPDISLNFGKVRAHLKEILLRILVWQDGIALHTHEAALRATTAVRVFIWALSEVPKSNRVEVLAVALNAALDVLILNSPEIDLSTSSWNVKVADTCQLVGFG